MVAIKNDALMSAPPLRSRPKPHVLSMTRTWHDWRLTAVKAQLAGHKIFLNFAKCFTIAPVQELQQ